MAGMIASEIGADVRTSKIATLLHDMGKAVTHKIEGKHHHIGAELARKAGPQPDYDQIYFDRGAFGYFAAFSAVYDFPQRQGAHARQR